MMTLLRMRTWRIAAFGLATAFTTTVLAQSVIVPVSFAWELSPDGGTTWQPGVTTVGAEMSHVDARLRVSWTSPLPTAQDFFGNARFDGVVQGLNGAGPLDAVNGISALINGFMQPPLAAIQGRRFSSDLIKIDAGDSLPPGQGTFVTVNNAPALGGLTVGNPVTVLQYRLSLDGSVGERLISSVLSPSQSVGVVLFGLSGNTQAVFAPATQPATLVIVPSPAGLAVAGVATGVLLRRRRRS